MSKRCLKYGRCGICNTIFKSHKQADTHFKSKRHKEAINNLCVDFIKAMDSIKWMLKGIGER